MNPTGSGLARAFECPGSCALPRAGHSGESAAYGKANHKDIEDGDRSKPVVREVLEDAEDIRHEVAYALDVERRSVRELGVGLDRGYGRLSDTEIALTVDVECRKGGAWWVVDWKSRERVTPARDNWQIRAGAMAVMARHGTDIVVGAIGYLDDSELDAAPFDYFSALGYWGELAAMLARVRSAEARAAAGGTVDVSAGAWCKYCPAIPHCPAHTRLAKALLGELDGVDAQIADLTAEQCGRAWDLLKRYDVIAERVKESIRTRARSEVVPLSGGRRLALIESQRRSLDTKKAAEMLGADAPYKVSHFTQVREVNTKETER